MLVLSRRLNETIMIGDDIEVMVVQLNGRNIRLGIQAPPEVRVHRKEVWELIHDQKCAEGGGPNAAPAARDNRTVAPGLTECADGGDGAAEIS